MLLQFYDRIDFDIAMESLVMTFTCIGLYFSFLYQAFNEIRERASKGGY